MSLVFAILSLAGSVMWWWVARRATKEAALYRDHAKQLVRLIQSGIITCAMLQGQRPVVTKAPNGMTMAEAQAHIDEVWASLQFTPKPGAGGTVN